MANQYFGTEYLRFEQACGIRTLSKGRARRAQQMLNKSFESPRFATEGAYYQLRVVTR